MNTGVFVAGAVCAVLAVLVVAALLRRRTRESHTDERADDIWAAGLVREPKARAPRRPRDRRELWAHRYGAGAGWTATGTAGYIVANGDLSSNGCAAGSPDGAGCSGTGCGGGVGCGGGGGCGGGCGGS